MDEFIRLEEFGEQQVTTLYFADTERQNQLCWAAIDELADQLEKCIARGVGVVVLASAMPGHWLEHAWLDDLCAGLEGRPQTGSGSGWFRALRALSDERLISIAAISGDCSGGGAELGWACDIRIAEEQARFAQIEINAGLTTGIGGCSRLMRLAGPGPTAEMVLCGRPISASRLYDLGAVSQLVKQGEAVTTATELAQLMAQKSGSAMSGLKSVLRRAENLPLADALSFEQETFQQVVAGAEAHAAMKAVQEEYDQGVSVSEAHHYDRWLGT